MQTLTLEQLRTAAEAGGISAVTLQARGGEFFLHIRTRSNADAVLSRARSTEPRAFPNMMLVIKELHKLGIVAGTFDLSDWNPDENLASRTRPDRAIAMKHANEAVEHDKWFRAQVAQGLAEADDPNTQWVAHEEAEANWATKRAELVKRVGKAKGGAA